MKHLVSAIFPDVASAHRAADELVDSGLPKDRLSVLTKEEHRDTLAGASAGERNLIDRNAGRGAVAGGAIGAVAGSIVALISLGIPGGFIVAGPIVAALGGAALGAGGASLVGALIGVGIPEKEARTYEQQVHQGRILVCVDAADEAEAYLARHVLERMHPSTPPRVDGEALTP